MLYISMQKCRYVVLAVCLLSSSTAAVGADGDDPSARSCGIKAVSINGVNIAPTYGTFKENSQNEWTEIPDIQSTNLFYSRKPKILITTETDRLYEYYLVKLDVDGNYRYIYIDSRIGKRINDTGKPQREPIKINKKWISPGVFEIEPVKALELGEYALFRPNGLIFEAHKAVSNSELTKSLQSWLGGVFWEFGIQLASDRTEKNSQIMEKYVLLEKLDELKKKNIITEQEFLTQKALLLNGIK